MSRPFVDPRMPARLGKRFFPDTCVLEEMTVTQNTVGEEIRAWTMKHTADCRFSSEPVLQRSGDVTVIASTHRAILVGSFHDVRPDTWRAKIDGVVYDITSVDWGEGLFTQLEMDQQSPEPVNA